MGRGVPRAPPVDPPLVRSMSRSRKYILWEKAHLTDVGAVSVIRQRLEDMYVCT